MKPNPGGESSELVGIARGGSLNLAGALFNHLIRFGITFLIARLLGPSEAGLYYQAFAFLAFLSLLASGGFIQSLTRFVAVHRADQDAGALLGTVRLGLAFSTGSAGVVAIVLFASAPWLSHSVFDAPALSASLRIIALALPATVFTDAALAATRGFKTMRSYVLINFFFESSMRIVLTGILLGFGAGLEGAVLAILVTNCLAAILAGITLKKILGGEQPAARYSVRELLSFSGKTWMSSLADNAVLWADAIILGIFRPSSAVGIYVVATRVTLLATLVAGPVATSFAPRIADLYRRGHLEELQRSYALVTSWIVRLGLPGFLLLILFPEQLLSIFGPGFAAAAGITVVLACAQMFNAATGPCGFMLLMSGHATLVMLTNVVSVIMNVGLNLWLIPRYGVTGAAFAWTLEIVAMNSVRLVQVWLVLRMSPFTLGLAKGAAAALVAVAAALGMSVFTTGITELVAGAGTIALAYMGAVLWLGVDADDRLVLAAVARRFRPRTA
ncbi:MAG: oligosaccharide flippase family protein [Actinomycetota bacterium]